MQFSNKTAAFAALSLLLVSGSSIAGPDWTAIERARAAAKQTAASEAAAGTPAAATASDNVRKLSHGPRAVVLPGVAKADAATQVAEEIRPQAVQTATR
ncbi:hypothetical protein GPA19_16740 [Azoarcus indigens]|uniref:DUF4148 domain-containing protein n=1 Tax=Azoarcus indigens TaxID=29545 RepID=A0A4R6DSJ8_9RHOO|nr:hypothetical protein [Azoarcus indigens]NMG66592.1 hypothetical protein [Azoarcus indigens]TDN48101.1 hypothetical protein C7389_1165 [Azoarcus indigens]